MTGSRVPVGLDRGDRWLRDLIGRLFPPSCALCGGCVEPGRAPTCHACWSRLPAAVPPRCRRCGAPGPRFADGVEACGECIDWPAELPRARAPYLMRDGAAELVRSLKYRGWTSLADRMGEAMGPAARAVADAEPDSTVTPCLVPVPLSAARRRRRGFNQAGLLAASLAGELGWSVAAALRRDSRGRRQARLSGASRRANVRELFRARPPRDVHRAPRNADDRPPAVVVDDVVTTASTAAACAEALQRAGWRPLGVVAFARTVGHGPEHRSGDG